MRSLHRTQRRRRRVYQVCNRSRAAQPVPRSHPRHSQCAPQPMPRSHLHHRRRASQPVPRSRPRHNRRATDPLHGSRKAGGIVDLPLSLMSSFSTMLSRHHVTLSSISSGRQCSWTCIGRCHVRDVRPGSTRSLSPARCDDHHGMEGFRSGSDPLGDDHDCGHAPLGGVAPIFPSIVRFAASSQIRCERGERGT